MKANILVQWAARILLMIIVAGSFLAIPDQTASAKPLSASFTDCASQTEIPQAECDALVALYTSANGAGWTNNTGWMQTDMPCSWYGISCDAGHVTVLELGTNNLSGVIPVELSNLASLQSLFLVNNQLTGSIPPEFGTLIQLRRLDLGWNQLTGSIPAELGNLTNLTGLTLLYNQLSGIIPMQLGNLTNLSSLYMNDNQLNGSIPPELGNLINLTILTMDNNQLSGYIPNEFGNMTSLVSLSLVSNQLTGPIPTELGNLTQITWLSLAFNQLDGSIPPQLSNLTNLTNLYLSNNQLSGSIPAELGNLTNLTGLGLSNNQLSGSIPPELGNLINLTGLGLSGNQLSGSIPPELGNLTKLTNLWLSNNQLTGFIPAQLGNLTNLTELYLGNNRLSGSIPTELGNLTNLTWLALEFNQLSGSIPTELGNLIQLQFLSLSVNQLSGSIPTQLSNLTNLTYLSLSNNQLTGYIPEELGSLTNLTQLELTSNQLSGSIPTQLASLTNLTHLGLGWNELSGSIPPELGNLTSLTGLSLSGNQLSGSIPIQLSNLTNLTYLWLGSNQLTGGIPEELGSLTNLVSLSLSGNQLSGEFPTSIINLVNLSYFSFDTCRGLTSTNPSVIAFLNKFNPNWSVCDQKISVWRADNSIAIPNGDTTPSYAEGTDLGGVVIDKSRLFEFKIFNTGSVTNLQLTGNPIVEISGDPSFTVNYQPYPIVSPGSLGNSFTIRFAPSSLGVHTATVSIASNDADNNPYTFTIQGVGAKKDAYEDDNDFSTAKTILPGVTQDHSIFPAGDHDYVKFTLASQSSIVLETSGVNGYDTEIALYDAGHNLIGYDNDGGDFLYSRIERTCGNPLPAGDYYLMTYVYEGVIPQYQLAYSTEKCLPSPWIGGISITSDKNVVAVGRPHVGNEVASYDGFSAGALTAYIPMLFKDAYGGSYDSAFYIQNVNAASPANISIKYYNSTGGLSCTVNDTIAALASKGYWVPGLSCLPVGWVGGVVVTSDQPIVANGRPHIGAEVMTYNSFSSGSLTSYLPMLFKSAFGGTYNAAFYVQNVGAATANITIKYYDSTTGALTCTVTDTVAKLASKGYWLPGSCVPANWVGGVVVTSNQPIVTVGRPHIGSQITTYNGFSAGGTSSYIPMLFKSAFGGTYNAAFYVQNVGASLANITIKYYKTDGTLTCTVTDTVTALASKGYWLPSTCVPANWVGGAVVTSDQPIVAVGRPHIGAQVTTYAGFTSGSLNSYLPMLFKDAYGGAYDSAFYVQNTEATAANVVTKFYDSSGALTCSRNDTLPAFSTLSLWLPSLSCTQ